MKNQKNRKKMRLSSLLTVLMAVLAACLLLFGTIGGVRAALIHSETYTGTMETQEIGVKLIENEKEVANGGALLTELVPAGKSFQPGKQYDEVLKVQNTEAGIDEYVRLTLYKYWTDGEDKQIDLDPDLIKLVFSDSENWIVADGATKERTVLYYKVPLKAGEMSDAAIEKIASSSDISKMVTQETIVDEATKTTTIKTTFNYDGLKLNLEASVDAVQTHHAADAIKSAWGVDVTINEATGELSLN